MKFGFYAWALMCPGALLGQTAPATVNPSLPPNSSQSAAGGSAQTPTRPFLVIPAPPSPPVNITRTSKILLPANTAISVTPVNEISSKGMKVRQIYPLQVAADVVHNDVVVIPRGAFVKSVVTRLTGEGAVGKSVNFDLTFQYVRVNRLLWPLKGKHHQKSKGKSLGDFLGSTIITGRSAVIAPGQLLDAFTAAPIYETKSERPRG